MNKLRIILTVLSVLAAVFFTTYMNIQTRFAMDAQLETTQLKTKLDQRREVAEQQQRLADERAGEAQRATALALELEQQLKDCN